MLYCEHISYNFGSKKVLNNLGFKTADSGIVGIFGHNGSGKSTLLKIFSGLLTCQRGKIELDGKNILDSQRRLNFSTKMITGALLQESSSDEKLSVLENMNFFARLMNCSPSGVQELIKQANLSHEMNTALKKLSGGMRRRCELYRTFLHKPRLLLLDEPTTGLDFQESSRFFAYLRTYVEEQQALAVFSSHNPDDFLLCDYLIMMHEGEIIAADVPRNFLDRCTDSLLEVEYKPGAFDVRSMGSLSVYKNAKIRDKKLEIWLKPPELEDCLQSEIVRSSFVKAFSIRGADMADLYERVLKERNNAQH